ncbi:MAG TPA: efflux RND transporter periplasmic adaptor subunit, partial [Longimicrobiales bacterium]|nr:efflux RND transporter periplasmic adaptor subunit [Longimicrobiales bacterium]
MGLSRRTISVTTVVVLVGALGTGIWWRLRSREGSEPGASGAPAATAEEPDTAPEAPAAVIPTFSADEPDPVEGATVVRDTLWIYVQAPATARAIRSTAVTSLVGGVVREVAVRENSPIAAGQVLVRIDTTELALEVERRRSEVLEAEADFQWRTMFDDEEIPDPETRRQRAAVARAESGLDGADAALREAEIQLQRATVRAPFAGRVADVSVHEGEHVPAGTELMTVLTLDPIEVEADV